MRLTWKAIRRMADRDELLNRFGLEARTPTSDFFTGLGLFSVGVLVGAGLGLLFAPRRGEEMRATVSGALRRARERGESDYSAHLGGEAGVTPPAAHPAGGM